MVMFWYPKDFTFVRPTEIAEFGLKNDELKKRNTLLIGASTDSSFSRYIQITGRRSWNLGKE